MLRLSLKEFMPGDLTNRLAEMGWSLHNLATADVSKLSDELGIDREELERAVALAGYLLNVELASQSVAMDTGDVRAALEVLRGADALLGVKREPKEAMIRRLADIHIWRPAQPGEDRVSTRIARIRGEG